MPGISDFIRKSLAMKVSLILAILMIVLAGGMGILITMQRVAAMEENMLKKGQMAANIGAEMYGSVLENAIDSGMTTLSDVFDRNYVLIEGYDWGQQPKYHTAYDSLTDNFMLSFQEKIVEDPDFIFAIGVDINGYLPTHNVKFQKPITGKPKEDLAGNRTKRIFNDATGLAAAKNETPGFKQIYPRDTGEIMWDISTPIYVKGKHWGGFRVAVSLVRLDAAKTELKLTLFLLFGGFTIIIVLAIFVLMKRSLKPVEELTVLADNISVGEGLDKAIQPKTSDEIGRLTKAIDRLRNSMKSAMDRLGE
jgi:HAMP domain-containing protein